MRYTHLVILYLAGAARFPRSLKKLNPYLSKTYILPFIVGAGYVRAIQTIGFYSLRRSRELVEFAKQSAGYQYNYPNLFPFRASRRPDDIKKPIVCRCAITIRCLSPTSTPRALTPAVMATRRKDLLGDGLLCQATIDYYCLRTIHI